ncbi:Phosphatidylinositol 3,4,5-trisphosphate-dependent Rac exchanger 1 protein [Sciurus carolinensis]|uniref:Phosphatidylinositol 3,4,5-trisphosphate-dependent Rac exchanger 1 protein n=1 Tax=Sciurus carolinensis TaxID=30640 RepID=A0AA41MYD6_SCICA|nr:Phosphatidylinositol 3,4,5-trisphosphate-dependent Rac exchanger 1 protein [Sciurus carolinensis]
MGLQQPQLSSLELPCPSLFFSFRSDNFSQDARNLFLLRSNIATQKFSQGYGPCVCRIHGQAQGLCMPSKLPWHSAGFGHHSCSFSQHIATKSHTRGISTDSETDSDDPYIFMAHIKTPLLAFQIPNTSMMDKNQSTVVAAAPGNKAMATPYHPHIPSHVETPPQSYPSQDPVDRRKDMSVSFSVSMPWHRPFSAVDSSHCLQGSKSEAAGLSAGQCILKVNCSSIASEGALGVLKHFQAFQSCGQEALGRGQGEEVDSAWDGPHSNWLCGWQGLAGHGMVLSSALPALGLQTGPLAEPILEALAADDNAFLQNCGWLMAMSIAIMIMSHYDFCNIFNTKLESIDQRITCYQHFAAQLKSWVSPAFKQAALEPHMLCSLNFWPTNCHINLMEVFNPKMTSSMGRSFSIQFGHKPSLIGLDPKQDAEVQLHRYAKFCQALVTTMCTFSEQVLKTLHYGYNSNGEYEESRLICSINALDELCHLVKSFVHSKSGTRRSMGTGLLPVSSELCYHLGACQIVMCSTACRGGPCQHLGQEAGRLSPCPGPPGLWTWTGHPRSGPQVICERGSSVTFGRWEGCGLHGSRTARCEGD